MRDVSRGSRTKVGGGIGNGEDRCLVVFNYLLVFNGSLCRATSQLAFDRTPEGGQRHSCLTWEEEGKVAFADAGVGTPCWNDLNCFYLQHIVTEKYIARC